MTTRLFIFLNIYYKENMYSIFKDKLHNCSLRNLDKYLHYDISETELNINIGKITAVKNYEQKTL